jgi:hexosaminidase
MVKALKKTIILIIALCVAWSVTLTAQSIRISGDAKIIPQPVSIEVGEGNFVVTAQSRIVADSEETRPLADYLADYLVGCKTVERAFVYPVPYGATNEIVLKIDPEMSLPSEGYRLTVNDKWVRITGVDYGGVFNGIQTFLQLLPPEIYDKEHPKKGLHLTAGAVTIEDYPRMTYRGVMLDVARTFVPKDEVLRFIDNLSHHKINRFHWHLTDDEGWRIEIKSYPRLHEVGGFRGGDSPIKPIYGAWNERYGGYYTQDEIREVVAYAAVRNIAIIPEIELPGHSRAVAIAYPEILCDYAPNLTASAGYDNRNVWCVAREENYAMLEAILGEVASLFPSGVIHLGGDEVETAQWSKCPHCKALMVEKGIDKTARLEDIFMERVIEIASRLGVSAGVWNEAVESGSLPHSTTVYGWENTKAARQSAAKGYPTVVMPGEYFYFDMRQSPTERGHIWAGIVSPEKVYSFDFAKLGFTEAEIRNVVGIEASFFSELLLQNGLDYLDYQMFPRVCALSELTWTPDSLRKWDDFNNRLTTAHNARMEVLGIKYRTPPATTAVTQPPVRTPAVSFTSNLQPSTKWPFTNLNAYKSTARATTTCHRGDWFLWHFAEPLTCKTIRVATGYAHLQRAGVPHGRVEASYDGKTFEQVATLHDGGEATFAPHGAVRAVRVVSDTEGNGESFVIIQPLEIR